MFSYDNLDHETSELDTYPDNGGNVVLSVDYDTLGDLVDYTYAVSAPGNVSTQHYAMSAFSPSGQPTVEVISQTGLPDAHYVLAYDQLSRIVTAVSDEGSVTTYRYDDDGRTVSVDTDDGAFTGTIVYDADNYELMESWGGANPAAVASQTTYAYDGDRLLGMQYERGTPLVLVENDSLRYCAP